MIYKNFELYKYINSITPIESIDITNKTLVCKEINFDGLYYIKNNFLDFCKEKSSEKNNSRSINIDDQEKSTIIKYVNNNYNLDYENIEFIMNISQNSKGVKDFGIINKDDFSQINLFKEGRKKYISFNNLIKRLKKKSIEALKDNEYEEIENHEFEWDLYFLTKKRKNS